MEAAGVCAVKLEIAESTERDLARAGREFCSSGVALVRSIARHLWGLLEALRRQQNPIDFRNTGVAKVACRLRDEILLMFFLNQRTEHEGKSMEHLSTFLIQMRAGEY